MSSQQQPTLKELFSAAASKKAFTLNTSSQPAAAAHQPAECKATAAGGGAATSSMQRGAQPIRKENDPAAAAAASGQRSRDVVLQPVQGEPQQPAKHTIISKAKQQLSRSTQMYLDLGQRDFGASRCSVCGMVYAKGQPEDEKLHKAYHTGALQGFKFQGWSQERVLLSEVAQGRLLMVLQTDPANHVKKVRELCAYVEKAHGITPGWLLCEPQSRVFLYVSSQRRIVGLAVVEPLKQAYRVVAPAGSHEQEVDSTHSSLQQPQQQQQQPTQAGSILDTSDCQQQQQQLLHPPQKRQQQQLLWPGLQKRGRLAALGRAAGSGGSVLLSDPSLHSAPGAGGCSVKADSCPTSLLAAAERLQMQTQSSGGQGLAGTASAAAAAQDATAGAAAAVACDSQQEDRAAQALPRQQEQQPQAHGHQQQPQEMPPPKQQQQQALPWQKGSASDAAGGGSGGGPTAAGTCSSVQRASSVVTAAAAAGGAGGSRAVSGGARSLVADQRRPVRALVGVRMVWVSPEQRRKGVATKLLDAARCNLVPGYVVPCNQVAFSQPTGDGVALAAAFAHTQQFLVYGMD